MNIFNKVALQGLKRNRTRTLVTIIGVVLSATLFTAVATFGTSLLQYMIRGSIEKYGDWHVNFVDVDAAYAEEQMRSAQVRDTAEFENIGYALLEGGKSPEKPYLFVAGFTDQTFEKLPVTLISGRMPENSAEVIVPNHVSIKAGVRIPVGESITLALGSREAGGKALTQHDPYVTDEKLVSMTDKRYTVVGTYERAGFEEHSAPGYTLITKADFLNSSAGCSLFVSLKNPHRVKAYVNGLTDSETWVLNEDLLRFYGVSDNRLFNTLLITLGGVLAAIIMIGSIFLIYNSFHISLNERMHQFGILMSVGATAKQLRNSVLFEGICIGAVGIPLGILTGIGGAALTLPIVAQNFSTIMTNNVPLTLAVSAPALAAAAVFSFITILVSAYIPARKAATTPVMECIRQTNEIKTNVKEVKISRFAQHIYGLEGTLALKNFRRNKRRYRSVVLSLTLSVALFVSGSVFGSTLKRISKELTVEADGDVVFYTSDMGQDAFSKLYDRIKTVDSVTKSTFQADLICPARTADFPEAFVDAYRLKMGASGEGQTLDVPLYAQFIEDDLYYDFIEDLGFSKDEYSGENGKVLAIAMNTVEHEVFFTGEAMNFTLPDAEGRQTKTIDATMVDHYPLDALPMDSVPEYLIMVIAPWQMKTDFDPLSIRTKLGLTVWSKAPSQTTTQLQAIIDEEGTGGDDTLLNLSSTVNLFRSLNFVVDVFTYTFVIMISLIAIANVFNTISTNIKLRRCELAMLRSVGMSEKGFGRMMNLECFFYGLRTLLFGIPVAGILSWLIYKSMAMAEQLEDFPYQFPFGSMAVSILGVFGIVFITMLYATGKIRKENIIDALRDDMD